MTKRDIIALSIALIVALMSVKVARMLFEISSQKTATEQASRQEPQVIERQVEAPSAQILVAEQNIAIGAMIKPKSVSYQKWPLDAVRPDHYAKNPEGAPMNPQNDPDQISGMRAKMAITKGQPLSSEMLADQRDRGLLSFRLTPGMRAVTIPLSSSSTAANIFSPGDIVDVYAGDFQGKDGLQIDALKILALDHNLTSDRDLRKGEGSQQAGGAMVVVGGQQALQQPPRTVTLEVKPEWVTPLLIASQARGATMVLRDVDQPDVKSSLKKISAKTLQENQKTIKNQSLPLLKSSFSRKMSSYPKEKKNDVIYITRGSTVQELQFVDGQLIPSTSGLSGSGSGGLLSKMPGMPNIRPPSAASFSGASPMMNNPASSLNSSFPPRGQP